MGQLAGTAVWSQWLTAGDVSRSLHHARWKADRRLFPCPTWPQSAGAIVSPEK